MPETFFFDLVGAPQLAALEILANVLQVAEQALLAEHQDLAAGEEPTTDADPQTWIADSILVQIHVLQQNLRRYRTAIDKIEYPSHPGPTSDEISF